MIVIRKRAAHEQGSCVTADYETEYIYTTDMTRNNDRYDSEASFTVDMDHDGLLASDLGFVYRRFNTT